jgi:septation ring formation regulator EzrA
MQGLSQEQLQELKSKLKNPAELMGQALNAFADLTSELEDIKAGIKECYKEIGKVNVKVDALQDCVNRHLPAGEVAI